MYNLGISCYYHDSAAALVQNGRVINAIQEERLTRIKHDSSFPINSIKKILEINNLSLKEIDYFVFYEKPFVKFERLMDTYVSFAPNWIKSYTNNKKISFSDKRLFSGYNKVAKMFMLAESKIKNEINSNFKSNSKK